MPRSSSGRGGPRIVRTRLRWPPELVPADRPAPGAAAIIPSRQHRSARQRGRRPAGPMFWLPHAADVLGFDRDDHPHLVAATPPLVGRAEVLLRERFDVLTPAFRGDI